MITLIHQNLGLSKYRYKCSKQLSLPFQSSIKITNMANDTVK